MSSMSSVWISKLGMSLFWKVPPSLLEFRQDINRLLPFRSFRVAVSRPCRLLKFTPYRALLEVSWASLISSFGSTPHPPFLSPFNIVTGKEVQRSNVNRTELLGGYFHDPSCARTWSTRPLSSISAQEKLFATLSYCTWRNPLTWKRACCVKRSQQTAHGSWSASCEYPARSGG